MTAPTKQKLTPTATVTVSISHTTDSSSEFWQLVAGSKFIVYEGVSFDLIQNILQSNDPDTVIRQQLSAYPKRVANL